MKPQFELLERYIEGDVTPEEAKLVEQLIKSDLAFKNEHNLRLEVNKAIQEKNIMRLRYKISMIHQQEIIQKTGSIRQIIRKNWHLAAASVTILIILGCFLLNNINQPGSDVLFEQYYSSDAIFTTRSGEDTENSNLTTGLQKFQKQDYDAAINLLKNIPGNIVSDYYLGISYIETKQFLKAKNAFNAITEQENNLFSEQAEWYKALCMLKLNELTEAKQLFTSISNSSSLYNQNAKEILKELN